MLIQVGERVVRREDIRLIDMSRLEELHVVVHLAEGSIELHDAQAVDFMMRVCPQAFEGRRLRFVKHAWAIHNLVGHPLMQLCAWAGKTRLGLWIHDATVPRPKGTRTR